MQALFTSDYTGPGTCFWDFGNGITSTDCVPDTVLFDIPGSYAVTLTIDPGFGCASTTSASSPVVVVDPPVAGFIPLPPVVNTADPLVHFNNISQGATNWLWQFDDLATSTEAEPNYLFPDHEEGLYEVCLIAYASPTCTDTVCETIEVVMGPSVFVPNTFTPDGDGHNDLFAPVTLGLDPTDYHFWVFDRWGQPLFDTEDLDGQWNGRFSNGTDVPEGVYVWKLLAKDPFGGARIERVGHVTLVR